MITIRLSNLDARQIVERLRDSGEPVLASFKRLAESIEAELEAEHDD